jgi:hypothetical protein
MKFLVVLSIVSLIAACGTYADIEVIIPASNRSPYRIQPVINGRTLDLVMMPNTPAEIKTGIQIPYARSGQSTEPIVDRATNIKVEFYNLDLKRLSPATYCDAGSKIRPSVSYETTMYGNTVYEDVDCRSLYYNLQIPVPDSTSVR